MTAIALTQPEALAREAERIAAEATTETPPSSPDKTPASTEDIATEDSEGGTI
jgi:hypothetical protein